jgi:hypothetical protein
MLVQRGGVPPTPVYHTVHPCHEKDIIRVPKSHMMVPNVHSHCTPRTMLKLSSGSMYKLVLKCSAPITMFASYILLGSPPARRW